MDGAQKLALPGGHSMSFSCRKLTASREEEDYIPEWYHHTHFLNQPSINALGSFCACCWLLLGTTTTCLLTEGLLAPFSSPF